MAPSTARVRIRARWQNPSVRAALTSIASLVVLGFAVTSAAASTPFRPCKDNRRIQCARIDVPLDRSGAIPGAISLNVKRLAARNTSQGAVIALAGGPGQAAAPLLLDFATSITRGLRSRDLIAYDQRGTGRSGLLRCPSLEKQSIGDPGVAVRACAAALGPKRALYTTSDSVEDMEAVRRAIGVERITIYGTSYGTKLALAYAARYPTHIERLVLDSILPLDGPDPFTRDILGAVPRVLRALCKSDACKGITSDPVGDVTALVKRLQMSPIRGPVVGGDGRRRMRQLGRLRLLRILVDGDLDPTLRAEFPAAVRSALRGDSAPLLRLAHRAALGEQDNEPPEAFSPALFVATTCEDGPLPWQRTSSLFDRWAQAISQAASLPESEFYPFDRATARASDTLRLCAHWPVAGPQPALPLAPLPNLPTLILSGGDDLRTPLEGATRVAAQIPLATRLVLPGTGHSALLNDVSLCADRAVTLFFEDKPVSATCPRIGQEVRELLSTFFVPTPVPPASLSRIPPAFRIPGRAGRTLGAFEQTLADAFIEELWANLVSDLPSGRPIGGLRAGRMRADGALDRYSYVPGVEVTSLGARRKRSSRGLLEIPRVERFRVGGERAAHGALTLDNKKLTIAGRLGGRRLRIDLRLELKRLLRQGKESSGRIGAVDRCCRFGR